MKDWLNLSEPRPWERKPKRKITTDDYMVKGWDNNVEVNYIKGSRHNKIGMWIMWTYYVLFAAMFIRGLIIFLR